MSLNHHSLRVANNAQRVRNALRQRNVIARTCDKRLVSGAEGELSGEKIEAVVDVVVLAARGDVAVERLLDAVSRLVMAFSS